MKILYLSHLLPYPPHGGSKQRNYNLIREIAANHEVYLLCLNQKASTRDPRDVEGATAEFNKFCKYFRVYDIPCERSAWRWYATLLFNLLSSQPYSVWRFRSPEIRAEIEKLKKEVNFDVIHIDTVSTAPYADMLATRGKVLNHHNVESTLLLRRAKNATNPLKKLYLSLQGNKLRRLEKNAAPAFDVNLMVSQLDAEELRSFAPQAKTHVVANGTDTNYFQPSTDEPGNELVYAGGMTWYPNQDAMEYFLATIFPMIQAKKPGIKMNVIGARPSKTAQELARKNPAITIHGFVKDVRPIIARSAVYVVPLRVGGGTRLKILDASAAGKALVSTSIGCEGIAVEHGKNIWIADDPKEFAESVIKLMDDEILRKSLEQNARKLAEEKYSWTVIAKELEQAYQDSLGD